MTERLHIVIPMECPGSVKPNLLVMPKKNWKGRRDVKEAWVARAVRTTNQRTWRSSFIAFALSARPAEPMTGALVLDTLVVLPRPANKCRRKDPDGLIWAPVYPDRDNAEKIINDALTKGGFWTDDRVVVDGRTVKVYHEKGGRPRIELWLRRAEGHGPNIEDLGERQGALF